MKKKWYESSTIWINLAGIIGLALTFVIESGDIKDTDILSIVIAIANILNRFRTKRGVTL